MVLNDEDSWPSELVHYLEAHSDHFRVRERKWIGNSNDRDFPHVPNFASADGDVVEGLRGILRPICLRGYHCTRLTAEEIGRIELHGLELPNREMLFQRIDRIKEARLIASPIAKKLRLKNEADQHYRAGMIWFVFCPPHLAGQGGIERFFRSWGGESLYNSHERDAVTGPILSQIGVPCLVEADVPIAIIPGQTGLEDYLCRQFLANRGFKTCGEFHHENRTTAPVPKQSIQRIIRFPEKEFTLLTGCDTWTPPLA